MDVTNSKHWYVLRAIFRKEEKVRDKLRRVGFHCYVPMCYRIETVKGHKVRRLVPAITELVFVYASQEDITDFKLHSKETIYWLTKPNGNKRERIVVPDKAMEDFIRVTQKNEQSITYFRPEELNLNKGDHIQIHGGVFDGIEGILLKVKGKRDKQLVVSIPGITAAAVSIRPEVIEVISKKSPPSCNLQDDTHELIRLSTRMLISSPDSQTQTAEYDMLYHEIHRLYESLKPLKGYLPSVEGELALSLIMAEQVLGHRQEETEQRFMKALHKQKLQSLLQVRMLFIGGTLLKQPELIQQANKTINLWKSDSPSTRQEKVIAETDIFTNLSTNLDI